jgi:hypothetical protein
MTRDVTHYSLVELFKKYWVSVVIVRYTARSSGYCRPWRAAPAAGQGARGPRLIAVMRHHGDNAAVLTSAWGSLWSVADSAVCQAIAHVQRSSWLPAVLKWS